MGPEYSCVSLQSDLTPFLEIHHSLLFMNNIKDHQLINVIKVSSSS